MLIPGTEADMFEIRDGAGVCPAVMAALRARLPKAYSDCALTVADPEPGEGVPRQL